MENPDDTLDEDVRLALQTYLGLNEKASVQGLAEELDKQIKKLEKEIEKSEGEKTIFDPEQLSIAIRACPRTAKFKERLKQLRNLQTRARVQQTQKLCPGICIQFQDLRWDQYYPSEDQNIKYPDVRGLQARLCKDVLIQKMMLFDLLQSERQQCCGFDPGNLVLQGFEDKFHDCPAILVPSSGKSGIWLGNALKEEKDFWWVRCKSFAHVIFLVSNEEVDSYEQFPGKGVSVVGYEGFGMGCGRAAGVNMAKMLGRLCIMADDRTKGLSWDKQEMTKQQLQLMMGPAEDNELYFGKRSFLTGVAPKGEINILSIINPATSSKIRPTF